MSEPFETFQPMPNPGAGQRPAAQRAKREEGKGLILAAVVVVAVTAAAIGLFRWHANREKALAQAILAIDWPEGMRHGATLELNGNPTEIPLLGPLEFRCPSGETRIVATSPGYQPIERTETLTAGQKQVLRFQWRELSAVHKPDSMERAGAGKRPPGASAEEKPAGTAATAAPPIQERAARRSLEKAAPASLATRTPAAGGEPAVEAKIRNSVPAETAQAKIVKQLDEVYHFDQAANTAAKLHLAEELRNQAGKTIEPDKRFVLLRKGAELAGEAGDAAAMVRNVDTMAENFEINPLVVKEKMLVRFAKEATTTERIEALVGASRQVVEKAVAADRYDVAVHVARQADAACVPAAGADFRQQTARQLRQVEQRNQERQAVAKAEETLATNPADPAANLTIGRWQALAKNDWDRGIPYLAKGNDAAIQRAARQEIDGPKTADAQAAAGDSWWDGAEKQAEPAKSGVRSRAASWYEKAWPAASVAVKSKIAKRLGELIAAVPSDEEPPAEVLRLAKLLAGDFRTPGDQRKAAQKLLASVEPDTSAHQPSSSLASPKPAAKAAGKPELPEDQKVATRPESDPVITQAWKLIEQGSAAEARKVLLNAQKKDHEDLRIPFSLGLLDALLDHEWALAVKDFTQCVRLKPDHVASLSNLAAACARLNDSRHALERWKQVLNAGPAPAELVQNAGRYQQVLKSKRSRWRRAFSAPWRTWSPGPRRTAKGRATRRKSATCTCGW